MQAAPDSLRLSTVGDPVPRLPLVLGQVDVALKGGDCIFVSVDGVRRKVGDGILDQGREIDDGLFPAAPVQAGQGRLAAVAAEPELFFIQIEKRGKDLLAAFQGLGNCAGLRRRS